MASKHPVNVREIWIRYIGSILIVGALMGGVLVLVQDEDTRFKLGGMVLGFSSMVITFMFERKLPDQNRTDTIFMFLDVFIFALGCLVVWQMAQEVTITQMALTKLIANPVIWFCAWAFMATSRLKMCIRATSSVVAAKSIEVQNE